MLEVKTLKDLCIDKISKEEAAKHIKNYWNFPMFVNNPPEKRDFTGVAPELVDEINNKTKIMIQSFRWGY